MEARRAQPPYRDRRIFVDVQIGQDEARFTVRDEGPGFNVSAFPQPEASPYQLEFDDLVEAIRRDQPYNEAARGAIASLVTSMGRMAAHTGQIITYEDMLQCEHEFAPEVDRLTQNSPAPLQLEANGRYPVPEPGIKRQREY